MNNSKDMFKSSFDKAMSQGVNVSHDMSSQIENYKSMMEELEGGLSDGKTLKDIAKKHNSKGKLGIEDMVNSLKKQLRMGIKVETEHTNNKSKAEEIALDHLWEDPNYYTKLKKMEAKESDGKMEKSAKKQFTKDLQDDSDYHEFKRRSKFMDKDVERTFGVPNVTSDDPYIIKRKFSRVGKEESTEATGSGSSGAYSAPLFSGEEPKKVETKEATGSGSVGAYETPAAWAKSTKKKDWRGGSKPLYKGGKFVSVKKKCTKFPYCNAGDINALDIFEDDKLKEAIDSVSKKLGINENVIKSIIDYEYVKKISNK
jgi:hypothetical protein